MALSTIFREAARFVPAAVQAFTSNRRTSAERRQQELLNQQAEFQRQAFDPNNPLFKQQMAIESANSQRNIARMVEEATRAQRRNIMMGRNPLFDNERADEIMNQFSNTQAARAAEAAPEMARRNILAMAEGSGNLASSMGNMANQQAARIGGRSAQMTRLAEEVFNPASGRSIVDVIMNRTPRIQQAAPTQPASPANVMAEEEMQRRSGGMNMANLPVMQNNQRGASRPFQGGRRFA